MTKLLIVYLKTGIQLFKNENCVLKDFVVISYQSFREGWGYFSKKALLSFWKMNVKIMLFKLTEYVP